MSKQLYMGVTGTTNIISVVVSHIYNSPCADAIVLAESTSLDIGDAATVSLGYVGDSAQVLTGYVKNIERSIPDGLYNITINDKMVRALDFFIVSDNPNVPFKRSAISAEDLIEDVMALAGLTLYNGGTTNFIYGYTVPVEVNLTGCYEFCKQMSDIVAWHLWVDSSGVVQFQDRKPYVMGGDSAAYTINDNSVILRISSVVSDDDLRNKVVVYGANDIYAESSTASPYLPAGYYKTAVLSSPYVDRQIDADNAASYNLTFWNRLRYSVFLDIEGDSSIEAMDIIHLTESNLSLDDDYFIYGVQHKVDSNGYITSIELRN